VRRSELAHVLRAAARIVDDPNILVIGSQAILGTYSEDELPQDAWMSVEADLAFLEDLDARKADAVDGAIGELSQFHETFTYYGQGVEVKTAVLPDGWQSRLVPFEIEGADPDKALCLDPHDLVLSKLIAMREKDVAFARSLLEADLVSRDRLLERAQTWSSAQPIAQNRVLAWLEAFGA
jgi:hypothetical protein